MCSSNHCDGVCQDAVPCASVEVAEEFGGQSKLPQLPQEEESLLSLLHDLLCVACPGEILTDGSAEEFEGFNSLHLCPIDVAGLSSSSGQ